MALSRHLQRARRLEAINARIAEHVSAVEGESLSSKLAAAAEVDIGPIEARPIRGPAARVSPILSLRWPEEECEAAFTLLRARAKGLRISEFGSIAISGSSGFAHIVDGQTSLEAVRTAGGGRGNLIFSAAGCDLSRMRIEFLRSSNSIVYFDPEVVVKGNSIVRICDVEGAFVYIGRGTSFDRLEASLKGEAPELIIGEDCLFDDGVVLNTGDGFSLYDGDTEENLNPKAKINIGDHVYLGFDTLVMKGADVGSGAVVAPRSVVTGLLEGGAFHSGFPAKQQIGGVAWSKRL